MMFERCTCFTKASDQKMQGDCLISVVTVVYNRAHEIESTIRSVLDQHSNGAVQFIVVDGGSTDGTLNLIKRYEKHLQWISEPDKGIYDAMNKGARMATGKWIIFVNAGDHFYDHDVLRDLSVVLEKAEPYVFVYGDAEVVVGNHKHIQYQKDRHLDQTKSIIHQSMFIRRNFLLQNPYNLKYRIMADYDNLLSVSVEHPSRCLHVNRIICRYDKTGVSSRPLYTYIKDYCKITRSRMKTIEYIRFLLYITPRLIWSYRLAIK